MEFDNMTPEMQEKAKACKSVEDIYALAKEEGYELSDEEVSSISGGDWNCWDICSKLVEDPRCSMHGFVC